MTRAEIDVVVHPFEYWFNHRFDLVGKLLGEFEVPLVVCGHGHDRAGAVGREDVVGDPDGNLLSVDRVDGGGAGPDAGLVLGKFGAFQVGLGGGEFLILLHRLRLFGRGDLGNQLVLRRQNHVGRAEECVRPGGENADLLRVEFQLEIHLRAFRLPDPVPLHFLQRIGPVDGVEVGQELLGVGGDAEHPLAHRLADDGEAADLALAVDDFLVGQDGAQLGTPVDRGFADEGEALGVTVGAAAVFQCAAIRPGGSSILNGASGGTHGSTLLQLRRISQRADRLGLVRGRVEPGIVDLEEDPLGPLEILGIGRGDFASPVVAEAERPDLPGEVGDVRLRRDARMLAGLDRVLLSRQAEGVPAHRVQDVLTLRTAEAREDVGGGVALGVADVEAGAGGIREHVEDVELPRGLAAGDLLGAQRIRAVTLGKRVASRQLVARVPGAEGLLAFPELLPFGLDEMKRILPARHRGREFQETPPTWQWWSGVDVAEESAKDAKSAKGKEAE